MKPLPGVPGRRSLPARARPALAAALLLAGCATTRIVPAPAPGVQIDSARATASVAAQGVELAVRPSAWDGSPRSLDDHVTPFLVGLVNGTTSPLRYDYASFRIFDESRFQYTALPPAEVERILRWRAGGEDRLAAAGSPPPLLRRRVVSFWDPWWWDRYDGYGWSGWPWYLPPGRPHLGDVYLRALPMGPLHPAARFEGFVYFPPLRATARSLRLEFHHLAGDLPGVLTLPFAVERDGDRQGSG